MASQVVLNIGPIGSETFLPVPIQLIVGLRNPGSEYEQTRHNAGGWFAEALALHYGKSFKVDKKYQGEFTQFDVNHQSCKLLMPLTFMNHSGMPVRAICQFYGIELDSVLVVHDELDLPVGHIKLKTGGGHGGHNGLRDIISQLGGANFHRLRIGIGHPGHKELVLNYVLGKPSASDKKLIVDAIQHGIAVIPTIVSGQLALAMNQLHG